MAIVSLVRERKRIAEEMKTLAIFVAPLIQGDYDDDVEAFTMHLDGLRDWIRGEACEIRAFLADPMGEIVADTPKAPRAAASPKASGKGKATRKAGTRTLSLV